MKTINQHFITVNGGERNGLGRREKRPEKIRETGETTLKNREKGEPAWKGRRENIIFLKLVIIFLDISLCLKYLSRSKNKHSLCPER